MNEENLSLGYHLAANSTSDSSVLVNYLDPESKKGQFMLKIEGLKYDKTTRGYVRVAEPLVKTKAGLEWVSNLIDPFFSVSATTNTLKDVDIYHLTNNLIIDISTAFRTSSLRQSYGLSIEKLDDVGGLIVNHCYLNVKRSENGGDRKLFDNNVKRVESYNISRDERQKKGFGGMNFLNR
jgi:hypothetical protein